MSSTFTTTTIRNKPKRFAWSWSRLKNFETCAKRHYHYDIAKDIKEDESEAILWGKSVHEALANRISKGEELPKPMKEYEKWAELVLAGGGDIRVEQQLAITKDFSATKWFGDDVWFRGIGDVIKVNGPVALVIDWKTGKITDESQQLALMAACVFAHYPEVRRVRSEFVWLREDASTRADLKRDDMPGIWRNLWPRIEQLQHAHNANEYPARPGGLCKRYCGVTVCPHHGEGR